MNSATCLSGRSLRLARGFWLTMFGLYVALYVLGLRTSFQQVSLIHPNTRADLVARGISPEFPALYLITLDLVTFIVFGSIALLIVLKQSDDWMVLLASLTLIATAFLYTGPGHDAPVPQQLISLVIALGEIFQVGFVFLFPLGRFVPRWLGWLMIPMFVWRPAIYVLDYMPNYLRMPHTIETYGVLRQGVVDTALMISLFVIGIGAQVYRYHRVYNPVQKQQTKWILWGMGIAILITGTSVVLVNTLGLSLGNDAPSLLSRMAGRTVRQIALAMLPLTIAISILRYRLWDIDLILRRTLVYVPLTGILAGLFAALVPITQRFAVALTGENSFVATILATLAVVAVSEPIRHLLQQGVKRRFKELPDPPTILNTFSARVETRLSQSDAPQLLARFMDLAVRAFQAEGGAAYLGTGATLTRVGAVGMGEERLQIPLMVGERRIGALSLGARPYEREYTREDRMLLGRVAHTVAKAIVEDAPVKS